MDEAEFTSLYYDKSLSAKDIAQHFGFTECMVKYYRRKFGLTPRRGGRLFYDLKFTPSPTLAYVLGVMVGDGGAYKNTSFCGGRRRSPQYYIRLRTTDEPFARAFCEHLRFLGMNAYIRRYPCEPRVFNVTAYCKAFYDWYTSLSSDDVERIAGMYPIEFLRGFYEAEGWVSRGLYLDRRNSKQYRFRLQCSLGFSNYNKELLEISQRTLDKLGFDSHLYHRYHKNRDEYYLMVCKRQQIYKLIRILNPCIKRLNFNG